MSTQHFTIENCEDEPIHIPGAIQPHGLLFACHGEDLTVTQVSENVIALLGVPSERVLNRPLSAHFDRKCFAHLLSPPSASSIRDANPFRMIARDGKRFDAVAHVCGDTIVVELEPAHNTPGETVGGFDPALRASVVRLQRAQTIADLMCAAAEEVRRLTGFDRVMVYRFDSEWNGEVVAECKRDDLEAFLGHHYPASDIPAQARRLYTVNWLRFVADVKYKPARLIPSEDPKTQRPLDLSHSVLRSVSPVHIEYLVNMGVTASMSISLVIDGVLAGLLACHHYSGPRIVPARMRDTAEYLGYSLSWQLEVLERKERAEKIAASQKIESEVVRSMSLAADLLGGLDTPALLQLAGASGAAIVLKEGVRRLGVAPSEEKIREIIAWLQINGEDAHATDHAARDIPIALEEEVAAGVLAITIARELGEYIVWFRPAVRKVIEWAGNPWQKNVVHEEGRAPRLSPRGSFELWREEVKGKSLPWDKAEIDAASSLRRVILAGDRRRSVELRGINEQLVDVDRARNEFIAKVAHEIRNPLNVVNGWAKLLKQGALDEKRRTQAIDVIERNVQVQMRLVEDLLDIARSTTGKLALEVEPLDIRSLLSHVVEGLSLAAEAKGVVLTRLIDPRIGPIRGDATRLRQVFANLIGNALKFTPAGGHVSVRLDATDDHVQVRVVDTGHGICPELLPHVFDTFRQGDSPAVRRAGGLGLGLAIARAIVEGHGGTIVVESEGLGKGATFSIKLPIGAS